MFLSNPPARIASQIRSLENYGDYVQSRFLAYLGQVPDPEQELFWDFYYGKRKLEAVMKKKNLPPFPDHGAPIAHDKKKRIKLARKELKVSEREIVRLFLDAVNRHDGDTILKIANAVNFFKGKLDTFKPADRLRSLLLSFKDKMPHVVNRCHIRWVEEYLQNYYPKGEMPSRNVIQRTCKELGIITHSPVAKQRKKR